jgi:hypothetical protein
MLGLQKDFFLTVYKIAGTAAVLRELQGLRMWLSGRVLAYRGMGLVLIPISSRLKKFWLKLGFYDLV